MASREDYESAVKHWHALGVGTVEEKARDEGAFPIQLAVLTRLCRPDEAIHVARWMEVQALLAGESAHYRRIQFGSEVSFQLYISRPLDEQDAIPQEVAHEA